MTSGEVYSFQNQGSGKYLTVHNGIDADKTNVYQSDYVEGAANQKFKLEYISSTGGYYLRAMCSSGGTNRVLDLNRINGYVSEGSNVQIYSPNDPLAQYWFIIGLGAKSFKLVPRTDMSLAITAYGDSNGTADGKSTTSAGNLFVSAYTADSYQIWQIRDSNNVALISGGRLLADGTYYINNKSSGKYLHYTATDVDGASGLIADLENTIRWKITPVGDNKYTIQSLENMQKYLCAESSTNVGLSNMTSMTDAYLWTLQMASGGGFLIRNVVSQNYLIHSNNVKMTATAPQSTGITPDGGFSYDRYVWRLASTEEYGSTYNYTYRELTSSFKYKTLTLLAEEEGAPALKPSSYNYLWCSPEDFTYTGYNTANATFDTSTAIFSATSSNENYSAPILATHKVTGLSSDFYLVVNPFARLLAVEPSDNIDPLAVLNKAKPHLQNIGYTVDITEESYTVDDIRTELSTLANNILVIAGHGDVVYAIDDEDNTKDLINYTYMLITDSNENPIQFTSASSMNGLDLSHLELVIFMGCNTGKNGMNDSNLPYVAVQRGATVAIGFDKEIEQTDLENWTSDFFKEIKDGKTVTEALDAIHDDYESKSIGTPVIYGDGSIKLN